MSISLRKAINDKCSNCTYDPFSGLGNWRQQVEACTVKTCPLWPVRPVSKPRKRDLAAENDSEAASDPETGCFDELNGRGATGVAAHD